ncbi:bifunctional hydroxymethylpyrimidine kinase/phosphomethylpyrimidine kinase [Vitiosangium sp. GDMCC 1.1324]|uniref:bifunctional hydroxymethylpyrimidine kinase/phosphomethylpyrimidine kinase n=1 Tax=Vitiosangium sp. (strain GDMCC 1.1324) TaxID=2138576 RepID=UPI000D3C8B54|nr:bifunctional hydroxymethylpyrimidine kinase/phosphomethylpyrimidine kinase [Vitiosangium sp. GDMCC 1.1324]PTL78142.1 bifunctional hydroxymethylpyrimidine kinase/phosphomethylpyrimidine kinase [Vitiosangium sp. GDMCC 1.1324]
MEYRKVATALTIAGSDSGGGAGIQADLRTFAFHRVHGTSALTAITAQNTLGVTRVDVLPPESVAAQIDAVATDIGIGAAKTGMLVNREIISAVAERVKALGITPLVVDPVMVSRAGARLIDDEAVAALREHLLPLATIVTPNRHEAQLLAGLELRTLEDMQEAARRIHQQGPKVVLVKGGAMPGGLRGTDVWFDGERLETLHLASVETRNTHGTGCTLSAAIAANLALGHSLLEATRMGKEYVTRALEHPLAVGRGNGPIGHFFPLLGA